MHRAMAEAMTRSAFTAPHATVFLTVDATETMRLRASLRARPDYADVPLSPLAFIAKAVTVAVRAYPLVNAAWVDSGEQAGSIRVYDRINLGIAVATPRGLLVPNVKDAGRLTLIELATAIAELTVTARDGHTRAVDLADGTLSITNVGVFGVDGGTPILNPGESVILCVGTVHQAPWVHEGTLAVREVVQLSLSFDHRVIDGATAAQFLADIGAMISDPALLLARI
jgi:pyruvate dehydrogenase E2 component (dihydrolipoamide acetyltransferase)